MFARVEKELYYAASSGCVSEVSSLLRDHPEIKVNWTDRARRTPLHIASLEGHVEVVKLLLAHPDINVNLKSAHGHTPFSIGCDIGHVSVIQVLLKDPRVDVTLDDHSGCTPLWHASCNGEHEVIGWLIASGRDLGDIKNKKGKYWKDGEEYTALEIARKKESEVLYEALEIAKEDKWTDVALLLERFMANLSQTRHELRVRLGVLDECAAEVFALIVFLCDGLLQIKPAFPNPAADPSAVLRFFVIAKSLPLDLQMVLCHRAVGSMRQNILHKDSEAAFHFLAKNLLGVHCGTREGKQCVVS